MRGLMDAYSRRRHRDLSDLGAIVALAYHEPKRLAEMTPPRTTAEPKQAGWWEQPAAPSS